MNKMYRRVLLLVILLSSLIGYGCAQRPAETQEKPNYDEICANAYHDRVLELELTSTPEAEEYEVYRAVLETNFISTSTEYIVIQNGVVGEGIEGILESASHVSKRLTITETLLDDFYLKNQEAYHFEDHFALDVPTVLLNREELCQVLALSNWDNFHDRYPHSGGLKEFSRVAFNAEKTQALVYVGNTAGGLAGMGEFILLAKEDDKWILVDSSLSWIS